MSLVLALALGAALGNPGDVTALSAGNTSEENAESEEISDAEKETTESGEASGESEEETTESGEESLNTEETTADSEEEESGETEAISESGETSESGEETSESEETAESEEESDEPESGEDETEETGTCLLMLADSEDVTCGEEDLPVFAQDIPVTVEAEFPSGIGSVAVSVTVNGTEVDAGSVLLAEGETLTDGVIWQSEQSDSTEGEQSNGAEGEESDDAREEEATAAETAVSTAFTVDADAVTASEPGNTDPAEDNLVEVTVTVTSLSGGTAVETLTFCVDQNAPVIESSYQAAETGTSFAVGGSASGRAYACQPVTLTLTVTEKNFCAEDFTVTVNGAETGGAEYTWESEGSVHTATLIFSGDWDYAVTCSCTDIPGNTAEEYGTDYFAVDTTAPAGEVTESLQGTVWSSWSDRILFGLSANTEVTMAVTASDAASGMTEIAYSLQTGAVSQSALASLHWTAVSVSGSSGETVSLTVSLPAMNRRYVVYVRLTDRAGNVTYLNSGGVILDDTAPEVRITGCSSGEIYNGDVTVSVEVTDPDPEDNGGSSGVASVTYQVLSGGAVTQTGELDTGGGDITVSGSLNNADDVTVEVTVTDRAGNSFTQVSESFGIDITAPEVVITGVEDQSANRGTVAPVVTMTDANFDAGAVTVTLVGANTGMVDISGMAAVTGDEQGMVYTFRDFGSGMDDIYTLTAYATDAAGNQTVRSITFSVNRNGSTYLLGTYVKNLIAEGITNAPQDIVVTEVNVDALTGYSVTYTLDGRIVTLTEGVDYSVSVSGGGGAWHRYVYTIYADVFQQDGTYVITIYSEDAAENATSNQVKEKEITFTVDQTAPVISLSDLEDGGRYPEDRHEYTVSVKDNVAVDTVEIYVDGVLTASYTAEDLEDDLLTLSLESSAEEQTVQVIAYDTAGNRKVSDARSVLIFRGIRLPALLSSEASLSDSEGTSGLPLLPILAGVSAGAVVIFLFVRRKWRAA